MEFLSKHPRKWLFILAFVSLGIKLWLSTHTFGTNDIITWKNFTNYIYTHGLFKIYEAVPHFNHPPLVGLWLWFLRVQLNSWPEWFPFFIRLPAILADFGSVFLFFKLSIIYLKPKDTVELGMLFALNPISIMVSGFHGNTDSVFMFLVFLSVHQILVKKNLFLSGAFLGLAMNIKVVPLLLLPAFFFWIKTYIGKIGFLLSVGFVFLGGFAVHLWRVPENILHNIFAYGGAYKEWGITRILETIGVSAWWYNSAGKIIIVFLTILLTYSCARQSNTQRSTSADEKQRGFYLLQSIGISFLIFFIFTPGFGVQYISWLLIPSLFLGRTHIIYTGLGSVF